MIFFFFKCGKNTTNKKTICKDVWCKTDSTAEAAVCDGDAVSLLLPDQEWAVQESIVIVVSSNWYIKAV